MKSLNAAALIHIAQNVTTLAACWRIERRDGVLILGTEHDRNIAVSAGDFAGVYLTRAGIAGSDIRSSSDLSADNLEVQGSTQRDLTVTDIRAIDIEAGLLDDATATLFLVNWQAPDDFQIVLRTGTIGDIHRTAEGRYRTELRGLAQKLSQNFIRTYSVTCDAELGDARCKFDIASATAVAEVSAVTSRRQITIFIPNAHENPALLTENYVNGWIKFTSGILVAVEREIKAVDNYQIGGSPLNGAQMDITFFEQLPETPEVGDALISRPGCNKLRETCIAVFDNLLNFRGHGFFVPGQNEVLKVGGQE